MGNDEQGDGDEDGFDFVVFEDEDGNETRYAILRILEVDGEEYALLTPVDADPMSEDLDIFVLRYDVNEEGEEVFTAIEDETFARVQAHAEALFAAEADADEGDDEE